ncbi:ATP-binding protein [Scytonema sp. NUACC21]
MNNWQEANQRYLGAALAVVREALMKKMADNKKQPTSSSNVQSGLETATAAMPRPSALQQLCATFTLSEFERDVLLLCAGIELDASWGGLCATIQGDPKLNYPTFSLALAVLNTPYWGALTPVAPLRRWGLIEVGAGNALTTAPLRIDERILHYLMGVSHLDEQLLSMVAPVTNVGVQHDIIVDSHRQIAQQVVTTWGQEWQDLPIIQLCGDEIASKRAIASLSCHLLGFNLYTLSAHALPSNTNDLYQLLQIWQREAALSKSVLLLNCDDINANDTTQENRAQSFIEQITSPLIVMSRDRLPSKQRTIVTFDVYKPTISEQRIIWQQVLGERTGELNGMINTLVAQFNLTVPEIHAACTQAVGRLKAGDKEGLAPSSPPLSTTLWDSCRSQARPKLDELAQRIEPAATWDDIVLPEAQLQTLRTIAAHVRQRDKVYQSWGFASKGGRGLGISALFAGVSGTGKTMSAEVLAQELQLDLYRIDLSSVVSKYIGETEKNLRRVFDAAEAGATILLFDEADALFGKRSEVKDSHDRYANMEVSYLLQRIESYQGLAILTTNLKDSIDTAFLRRIRFIVKYPFPDANQREEIWRRIFPKDTPTVGLDFIKLAKLNVAGGNIRNIALNAAFIAADANEAIGMKHIKAAAVGEYVKLDRTLADAEIKGWV